MSRDGSLSPFENLTAPVCAKAYCGRGWMAAERSRRLASTLRRSPARASCRFSSRKRLDSLLTLFTFTSRAAVLPIISVHRSILDSASARTARLRPPRRACIKLANSTSTPKERVSKADPISAILQLRQVTTCHERRNTTFSKSLRNFQSSEKM